MLDHRKIRKGIRFDNSQAARNPEIIARGLSSPPRGLPQPFSVSPVADSLHNFAEHDITAAADSPAVRLAEFMGKKTRPRRRRRRPAAAAPGFSRRKEIKPDLIEEAEEDEHLAAEVDQVNACVDSLTLDSSENPSGDSSEVNSDNVEPDILSLIVQKLLQQLDSLEQPAALSEDETSRNKQEQEDEVVALEAIYEGSFKPLTDGCYMIQVPVKLADDTIQVFMEQASSSTSSSSPLYSFTLEFLPPVCFAFKFPSSYPTGAPPVFVLESQWLPAEKLVLLSDKLSEIWEDQKGQVVIYPWEEFLQSQALSFLGASQELLLDTSTQYQIEDPRIISGTTSQQNTAVSLLAYNEEMRENSFLSSLYTCNICFTEYLGKEFVKLPCQHIFCKICMQQHSAVNVKEGSVHRLNCPSCPCAIPAFVLKELLGDEAFERWESLLLQKTLDSMSDVVYCPRCEMACIEDEENDAQCEKCFFCFCTLCSQTRHAGQQCLTSEARLMILEGRAKGNRSEDQRRKELNQINELKNIAFVKKDSKLCPTCRMAIQKTAGCNKMTCPNCGKYFCYTCGRAITGYEHFRLGECHLFGVEAPVDREIWEMFQRNQQLEQAEQAIRQNPERVRLCPACRQRNVKMNNNNHMICHNCQNRYCGVCLKIVRNSAEHFGPSKCRQHTVDVR